MKGQDKWLVCREYTEVLHQPMLQPQTVSGV
jgi:hypothetical protein